MDQEPTNSPAPENPPAAPENLPAPENPPAAEIVVEGKTEREIVLETELEAERKARRKAETDAAYAQDESRRLKEIPSPGAANTRKPRRPGFTTLLHSED
jgi:hypothetical protein